MQIRQILQQLKEERQSLTHNYQNRIKSVRMAIRALSHVDQPEETAPAGEEKKRKKRFLSADARRRISEAQKLRWSKVNKNKNKVKVKA